MDKPNFLEFWVKMAKMTLNIKVNDLHFQYHPRLSQDACLVQIWWIHLKLVTSYRADKVKFTDRRTDGRTDGQTQATTIPLRPERPRGKNQIRKFTRKLLQTSLQTHVSMVWLEKILSLPHWGRVMHICVSNLTITGSDNGLSPGRRQAVIWTNAGILLIGPLGTNSTEILIEIYTFPFKKMHLILMETVGKPQADAYRHQYSSSKSPWKPPANVCQIELSKTWIKPCEKFHYIF